MNNLSGFIVLLVLGCGNVTGFLYDNVDKWIRESDQCDECAQSPIHLIANHAETLTLPDLILKNYHKDNTVRVSNNGDTVLVTPNIYLNATVTGGHHRDTIYQTETVVFHWGDEGVLGSEHKIDYRKYDLEMQIVHRNIDYTTVEDAVFADDGFLILAVLFKEVTVDVTVPPGIKAVCDALDRIKPYKASATLDVFRLSSLIDRLDMNKYFTYCGSLTVPPCTPNVVWIVFSHVLDIHEDCLKKLRRVKNNDGKALVNNFRPLQQLMDRRVFYQVKRLKP